MIKYVYEHDTTITADKGKYLKLLNVENSEEVIGKPHRIIFDNNGIIPEFEEIDM